jgi:hypothetical protein
MNIKELTEQYLNTLNNISQSNKEKIIKINSDSDYIVFSAASTDPVDIGVTESLDDETNMPFRFSKDYGGFKKLDQAGYMLVDESEYNPFYPHPDFSTTRKVPFEPRRLDEGCKRDANGFLKFKKSERKFTPEQKAKGEEDG